jgi:hypothetical protein
MKRLIPDQNVIIQPTKDPTQVEKAEIDKMKNILCNTQPVIMANLYSQTYK